MKRMRRREKQMTYRMTVAELEADDIVGIYKYEKK